MTESRPSQLTEYILLASSGAGLIASVVTQSSIYASAPLTLLTTVGLVNRRRLENQLEAANAKQSEKNYRLLRRLNYIGQQISALPSPTAMTNFQRATIDRTDRALVKFSRELRETKQELEQRFASLNIPDLSSIHHDIHQLKEKTSYFYTSVENLTGYVNRLSSLPRLEIAETQLAQLETEVMRLWVNLESLTNESRTAVSQLNDSFNYVERGLKQLPITLDPRSMREEIQQLIHTVANLVPQDDFNSLAKHLDELHEQQSKLQRDVENLFLRHTKINNINVKGAPVSSSILSNRDNSKQAQSSFHLDKTSTTDYLPPKLASLQQEIFILKKLIGQINSKQQIFDRTLNSIFVDLKESKVSIPNSYHFNAPITSFKNKNGSQTQDCSIKSKSHFKIDSLVSDDYALVEQAIDCTQERLLLVWPWTQSLKFDGFIFQKLQQLLERGCHLEIGCHQPDIFQQGLLLPAIARHYNSQLDHIKQLKKILAKIAPLRRAFPKQLRLRLLRTNEVFLVCDRNYAITAFDKVFINDELSLKFGSALQVKETSIIDKLIYHFEDPVLIENGIQNHLFKGIIRYGLQDLSGAIKAYNEVLQYLGSHAVALNNRGVAYAVLNRNEDAEADFTEAISSATTPISTYYNRGWLYLSKKAHQAAIRDFSKALYLCPKSPVAYIYRGSAFRQLGDLDRAISDYSCAIQNNISTALPYIYRGTAYHRKGKRAKAISDLEAAKKILENHGDQRTLLTVNQILCQLRH